LTKIATTFSILNKEIFICLSSWSGFAMQKLALGIAPALALGGLFALAPIPASADTPALQAGGIEICLPIIGCIDLGGGGGKGGPLRGAPGPVAGAGLPFLALGAGAYWLIKRRRKSA
jgi:hypothetical protein